MGATSSKKNSKNKKNVSVVATEKQDDVIVNDVINNDLVVYNEDDDAIFGADLSGENGTQLVVSDDYSLVDANENEILRRYIQQISKFPVLTQQEEERLLHEYLDNNNQKAGQMIILSHLRLVVKIAMKYRRYGLNLMDIIAEGNTGLMKALQKFDRSKNTRFSTYAVLWVRACVQEFVLKSWSLVKVGSIALRKQLLFNLGNIKKMLHIDNETSKEEQEKRLADHFGVSKDEFSEAQKALRNRDITLDAPVNDNNENLTLLDTISRDSGDFENIFADEEDKKYKMKIFHESLSILDERQREVIISRYLSENKATLDDLSKKYNISKERVRQIEASGIKKLKQFAENYDKDG